MWFFSDLFYSWIDILLFWTVLSSLIPRQLLLLLPLPLLPLPLPLPLPLLLLNLLLLILQEVGKEHNQKWVCLVGCLDIKIPFLFFFVPFPLSFPFFKIFSIFLLLLFKLESVSVILLLLLFVILFSSSSLSTLPVTFHNPSSLSSASLSFGHNLPS